MRTKKEICSIILKVIVVISSLIGVLLSVFAPSVDFMGGKTALMYFTIQSNLWMTIVCAIGLVKMIRGDKPTRGEMLAKFVFTVSITLTGIVFCVMLAPTMGESAWELYSIFCHVIVPIASVTDFLLVGGMIEYHRHDVWLVALPPLYYVFFASAGYVLNWDFGKGNNYPYFFFNWGSPAGAFGFCDELPYLGVIWWILILLVFLLICGSIYIAVVRKTGKKAK